MSDPLVVCSHGNLEHRNLLFRQMHDHLLMLQRHLVSLESNVCTQNGLELDLDCEGLYAVKMEEIGGETQRSPDRALSSLLCSNTCDATAAVPTEARGTGQGLKFVQQQIGPGHCLPKSVARAQGDADAGHEVESAAALGNAQGKDGFDETDNVDAEALDQLAQVEDDEHKKIQAKIDRSFTMSMLHDDNIESADYNVENFYKDKGFCQAIARSKRFQNITLFVISLNAIYLGVESEGNNAARFYDAAPFFIISSHVFCTFFFFEWVVRFGAFSRKTDCLRDGWFKFDSVLMLDMAIEVWMIATSELFFESSGFSLPTEPFRLVRLFRLTRMTRLMRSITELLTLIKGLYQAVKAVSACMLMVALLVYIFGILTHMLLKEEDAVNAEIFNYLGRQFTSLPDCCWTLLLDGALLQEAASVLTLLRLDGGINATLAYIVFFTFTVVSHLMLMNMLIGILCEVVYAVSSSERDDLALVIVKDSLLKLLQEFDDGDGLLTREEVDEVMASDNAVNVFRELNVDSLFVMQLLTTLFRTEDTRVSITAIIRLMLMCRGDLSCTVQHIAAGQAFIASKVDRLDHRLDKVFARHGRESGVRRSMSSAQ